MAGTVAICVGALALCAAPASAGLYHSKPAACSFGPDGSSGSSFPGAISQIAFQQESKRLYVASDAGKTYGFDASAVCPSPYPLLPGFEPLLTPELSPGSNIAVDNSALPSKGNIYIANGEALLGYDFAGNPLPGFPIPKPGKNADWKAVAVDPSGDVWAAELQGVVHEYSPAGAELQRLDLSQGSVALRGAPRVAFDFDSSGDLYVSSTNSGAWKLAAPAYESPLEFDPNGGDIEAITVDRASGDLYVAHNHLIKRYDSVGNLIEQFPAAEPSGAFKSIAIDESSKAVYAYESGGGTDKVFVFQALTLPDLATAPLTNLGETTATLNGSVHPDGVALTGCKFEWVSEAAYLENGFQSVTPAQEHECEPPFGGVPTAGTTAVSAAISGLVPPEGRYRFRLSAANENGINHSKPVAFALAQPGVETIGSPIRAATTARLDSRIDPHGIATTYRFQYISDAAYQANLAASNPPFEGALETSADSAGSGGLIVLASKAVSGLSPATTYHYRALADNGAFGGEAAGEARALTTRASDQPLTHGPFPGPPGSDRAWEQVNLPDTSGNPVSGAGGVAGSGETVLYNVAGGTRVSEAGTFYDYLLARRPPGEHPEEGWQTKYAFPSRAQAPFGTWLPPTGDEGLTTMLALNKDLESGSAATVWRLPTGGGAPQKLYEAAPKTYKGPYVFSDDGSRALLRLEGKSLDKEHESPSPSPGQPGVAQLYDVSSGEPHMVSLLPGAKPGDPGPACGVQVGGGNLFELNENAVASTTHWLSADGSRAFFFACGHLYMRDFEAKSGKGETVRVDGPPLSPPDCPGALIRSTPGAAYLWTQSRLAREDTAIGGGCAGGGEGLPGGDVYRYEIASGEFECLTCGLPGGEAANVNSGGGAEGAARAIAVAGAGPRLYFTTRSQLLPGAAEAGKPAIYRVNTETDQLAYVAPLNPGEHVGENPFSEGDIGGTAISPDGRFLAFRSAAAGLNQLSASDNGNTPQDYIYDDLERSLSCASCPADGSPPLAAAAKGIISEEPGQKGPNMTSLADNGDFAFSTPTSLVGADQNTARAGQPAFAGTDAYEWRDGRALLVSDGLTDWPDASVAPQVAAISPSGRDLFFTAATQLTPDALDGYARLYDARIGGGISFPEEQGPCPLEVCQGTPKGTPEEAAPGTSSFAGAGNEKPKPHKHKKKHKHKAKQRKRGSSR